MTPLNRHRLWQLVADGALIGAAWFLAFQLRFDNGVPPYYQTLFERTILIVVAIKLFVFILFGFYDRWWRYVSTRDMWGAARGVTIASLIADVTVYFVSPVANVRLPRSIAVMDWLILLAFVAGTRLLARTIIERPAPGRIVARGKEVVPVAHPEALVEYADALFEHAYEFRDRWLARGGTAVGLSDTHALGALPVRNYTTNIFPEHEAMNGLTFREHFDGKHTPCWACRMNHLHTGCKTEGRKKGFLGEEPEYEGFAAFGP